MELTVKTVESPDLTARDLLVKSAAVIGAAGKMGSGISLLLLQEMARQEAESTGFVGSGNFQLVLIDSREDGLFTLKRYLRQQIQRYAEKNIISLRSYFSKNPSLVSNEEMISAFVEGALDIVSTDTELHRAQEADLLFEAVIEDRAVKVKLLSDLQSICKESTYFFSNTSSIPISELNAHADLKGRIIGFHFYNPPAVQRLLELIPLAEGDKNLEKKALELAKRWNKIVVTSKDVAGFIGNGYFMRTVVFACELVRSLSSGSSGFDSEAIVLVNRATQSWLLRPMGIFQLIDYVGLDVCRNILQIMGNYLPQENFQSPLIEKMAACGAIGGQLAGSVQKNGFFRYQDGQPASVFSLETKEYIPCPKLLDFDGEISWKMLHSHPQKSELMKEHFVKLALDKSIEGELAQKFLSKEKEIGEQLVKQGVAASLADVETVLKNGFGHL
jgi:3-hydroxyacyl-CoA dehydrogenase